MIRRVIWEKLVDFLFPKICVGCGEWETFLCNDCYMKLDTTEQICPMCFETSDTGWTHSKCKKKAGLDGLVAIFDYENPVVSRVIEQIKYGFNKALVEEVLRDFKFESGMVFDIIVPVPLYFYRYNWRGFNQAEEIGRSIGRQLGVRVDNILSRIKYTKQQASLRTMADRKENVKNAFEVVSGWRSRLRNKKILLVDDVFTSGADMLECTRVLKEFGAEMVWGIALAR